MIVHEISRLYVGYFNRAPDRAGFEYWAGRANDGMPVLRDMGVMV